MSRGVAHKVNLLSFVNRGRANCTSCGRRIRRGESDVLLRDLTGKVLFRFYHLGGKCEAAAQALIDADSERWRGARRHVQDAPTGGEGNR
jgi:hypothetical protein